MSPHFAPFIQETLYREIERERERERERAIERKNGDFYWRLRYVPLKE